MVVNRILHPFLSAEEVWSCGETSSGFPASRSFLFQYDFELRRSGLLQALATGMGAGSPDFQVSKGLPQPTQQAIDYLRPCLQRWTISTGSAIQNA